MMNLNEWQLMRESLGGATNLGIKTPASLGLMGSRLTQEWEDDEDEDEDEDDFDGEHLDDDDDGDEDDDGKEGDLVGSTDKDDGPTKNWPPDGEDAEDTQTPDFETGGADDFGDEDSGGDDDFLASISAGAGGGDIGGGDDFGGDDFGGDFGGGDDFGGDDFGGDFGGGGDDEFGDEFGVDDDFLASVGQGAEGGDHGGLGGDQGEDMGFLDQIPSDLFGGEFGGEEDGDLGGDLGGHGALGGGIGGPEHDFGHDDFGSDDFGGEAGGEPCPDCNPNGEDAGDPACELCGGQGFLDMPEGDLGPELTGDGDGLDALGGDDLGGDDELAALNDKMASYMKKYMKKEWSQFSEFAPVAAAAAPALMGGAGAGAGAAGAAGGMGGMGAMMGRMAASPMAQNMAGQAASGAGAQAVNNMMQPQQQQMKKRMIKFMSKKGERSFMAADSRKHNPKNPWKKHCPCESFSEYECSDADFLKSLTSGAQRGGRGRSGYSEDALFAFAGPGEEYAQGEPQAGTIGFAPQGRVGSIGGGYTQQDVQDIPVMESHRYPTLAQYAAMKARKKSAKRRK